MKLSPIFTALLLAPVISVTAQDKPADKPATEAKPAAASAEAATGIEAEWKEIEGMMRGPKEQPKTQEEAKIVYKQYITDFQAKADAFLKAHPEDARRWKLALHSVQTNQVRKFVGLDAKSEEDIDKLLAEVVSAKDADKETQAMASFILVMNAQEDADAFEKKAEAHKKAFPDFKGNPQLDSRLASAKAMKEVKTKPLELSFKATDGKDIDIAQMKGKVVLVDFWATWCGPCVAELPNVLATYKKLHDKGFEILGISFDKDKEKLEAMTKEKGMTWPQYFDGEGWQNKFGQRFGISSIPSMWLVNKKGMVVDTEGREDLEKKVEKLLAEE